ncbi:MAG TPA: PIG-L family deacetylase [Anaerolineales bacterium]|nr:PIG-L family deacetylase [Anaerolineales bacterium]
MRKTLLAIMAHPDDESFGIGGTLARYAAEGVDVHLICATGGEHGTVDPELLDGHDSIAALRESELRCAVEKLGLAGLTMAGYKDSGMAGTDGNEDPDSLTARPVEEVAAHLAQLIREIRPQVVITHDPIGNYLHPDHIACNRAATLAFELAGDPSALPETGHPAWQPARLYYNTFPKRMFRWFVRVAPLFRFDPRRFGRNEDIDLVELVETGDFPVHTRIDYRRYAAARDAAAACHKSQLESGPPNAGPLALIFRLFAGVDLYMQAYPEAGPRLRERDLFAGI